MSILEAQDLTLRFGGLTAVNSVDFVVEPGKIFSVIGPNGAGKTTVFNAITGIYDPTEGRILFQGREVKTAFTARTAAWVGAIAAMTALGALVTFNLEPLWAATVTKNFVYQEPFPYMKAWGDLFGFLRERPLAWTALPGAIGAAIGAAGAMAVWSRARRAPNVIAAGGIARTFQNIRLFQQMTVLENVLVGMDSKGRERIWDAALRLPRHWREQKANVARAMELLKFVELDDEALEVARGLPYGHQRRLEIARALATGPKLLLLDEPAAGMNPSEAVSLMQLIRKIRDSGVTVLLIEHHMDVVMGISDRIVVLDYGTKIAEGAPDEVRANPKVIEAYLGKEDAG